MTKSFKHLAMMAIFALVAAIPELSFAATGTSTDFETALCRAYACVFGSKLVVFIATVAIIFLGIGAFFGKLNWGLVIVTVIGIVVIAGAGKLAVLVADGAASDECTETCS